MTSFASSSVRISPAQCGGLIEGPLVMLWRFHIEGFPPRNAGASLKDVREGRAPRRAAGFPPRNAGASLKDRGHAVRRPRVRGFPPRNAGASLKAVVL